MYKEVCIKTVAYVKTEYGRKQEEGEVEQKEYKKKIC